MLNINNNFFKTYFNIFQNKFGLNSNSSLSIFKYSDEFKEFLDKNTNEFSSDNSINISELLKEEFLEKLQNESEYKTNPETAEEENSNFFEDFFLELAKDEDFVKSIDTNQDGTTDKEELENFFNAINEDNNSKLSIDELFGGLKDLKNGELEGIYADNEKAETPPKTTDEEETTLSEEVTAENTPAAPSTDATVNSSAANTASSSSQATPKSQTTASTPTVSKSNTDGAKSLNNMSLDELEQEKTSRNEQLTNAQHALNDVFAGNNDAVKEAQELADIKQETYEHELEKDENVSQELKDEQRTNSAQISKKESEISEIKTNINNKNSEIFNKKSVINQDDVTISDLETAINALSSEEQSQDENPELEKISVKETDLTSKLAIAKAEKLMHEKELSTMEEELNSYNASLNQANEEKKTLEIERDRIESEISATCGMETQKAMLEYKSARDALGQVKQTEETNVQEAIKEAQEAVKEVENVINTKKAEQQKQPLTANPKLKSEYLTDENSNMSYLLIGPENTDPDTEYPVMVFLSGEAQHGAGENGLYANTTPAGAMQGWNLENFNGYIIIPSQPANMKNWYNNSATNAVKSILDNFKSTHKTGKTVIAGASSGAPGAGYMASKLGKDYFDEVVSIAGIFYGNTKVDMPVRSYVGSEDYRVRNMRQKFGDELNVIEGANHNDVVKALFNADKNNNGKSDFLELLFGNQY